MTLKIAVLNSRGCGVKIHRIINTFNSQKLDILGLQEVHDVSLKNVEEIEKHTNATCFVSRGSTHGRGVLTIMKKSELIDNVQQHLSSNDGNYLAVSFRYEGKTFTFLNIYAYNDCYQRAAQFRKWNEIVSNEVNYIYGGDFNCIENFHLDCIGKKVENFEHYKKDRQELEVLRNSHDYVDTLRFLHPNERIFTFTGLDEYRARLDKIYIHSSNTDRIKKVDVFPVSYSDHSLYIIQLGLTDARPKWGRGLWKFNTSLLENNDNFEEIRRTWLMWRDEKTSIGDNLIFWEYGKRLVKDTLIGIGQRQKKSEHTEIERIEQEIQEISKSQSLDSASRLRELKKVWNELEEKKTKGAAIRSRVDWETQGERPTTYFFSLEKKNGAQKSISSLRIGNEISSSKTDILNFLTEHYEKHFSAISIDQSACEQLVDSINLRLIDEDMDLMQKLFTMEELQAAHKKMRPRKSPGNDGLSYEFYDKCWAFIKHDLLETVNEILMRNEFPVSMTQGVVTLMYKNKGDPLEIKSYRPLSLLNTDYKYLTSMIASRLEKVMHKLTSPDQGCSVKGRHIEDQLILLQHIYDYARETGTKIMLQTQDLSSAFDVVSHEYLSKVLRRMNLGPLMERIITNIYSNMYTAIQINGAKTKYFHLSRSIRQGDPMASYIFVLSIEPLANSLRTNNSLHPVLVPNLEPKLISQYCDDTNILSTNIADFETVQKIARTFEEGSGAKFNHSKSEVLLMGSWSQEERSKIPKTNIRNNVRILGIWFGPDSRKLNSSHIIEKVDSVIDFWKNMNLSYQGKKLILETKILSQVYYTARVTGIGKTLKNSLHQRIVDFFWFPRKMKLLSFTTLQNDFQNGGVELPNLDVVNKALLVERVSKVLTRPCPWKGQFIYWYGRNLSSVHEMFTSADYQRTYCSTVVSITIFTAIHDLKGAVTNWENEDFRSLKRKLHKNFEIRVPHKDWLLLRNCTSDRKAADLSYLIAHDALTTKSLLVHRNVIKEDTCSFCGLERETQAHLFCHCPNVKRLKKILECKLDSSVHRTLSEEEILYHECRVKMKRRCHELISQYKMTIWSVRAKLYYGEVKKSEIDVILASIFEHRTVKK